MPKKDWHITIETTSVRISYYSDRDGGINMDTKKTIEIMKAYFLAHEDIHMPSIHMHSKNVYIFTRNLDGFLLYEVFALDEANKQLIISITPGVHCLTQYYDQLKSYINGLQSTLIDVHILLQKNGMIFRKIVPITRKSLTMAEIHSAEWDMLRMLSTELENIDAIAHGNIPIADLYTTIKKDIQDENSNLSDETRNILKKVDEYIEDQLLLDSLFVDESINNDKILSTEDDESESENANSISDQEAEQYAEQLESDEMDYNEFLEVMDDLTEDSTEENKDEDA